MKKFIRFGLFLSFLLFSSQLLKAQDLVSVSPDSSMQGNHVMITIIGTQSHFTTINNAFFISLRQGNTRISPDSFNAVNDSLLYTYFTLPYNVSGWCDMNVMNFTDGNMVLPTAFFIETSPTAPNIVSIVPDSAYQGVTVSTIITTVNTNYSSGSITRLSLDMGWGNRIDADSIVIVNDTSLVAIFTIPFAANTGLYDLRIDHSTDGTLMLNDGFEIIQSRIYCK